MSRTYCMDVLQWTKEYDGEPFHALLCDPPYHLTSIVKRFGKTSLDDNTQTSEDARQRSTPYARGSVGFMGQEWDGGDIAFRPETWYALAHHLYEGGFGIAYGASRNYHRLACAIEDAGLIIHPMIGWVYSSGFPKATNILKGAKRNLMPADEWAGHRYGLQALKPALEPIVVFQRPYKGKPIENILRTGAGAINIDATRIPSEPYTINTWDDNAHPFGNGAGNEFTGRQENARWPANLIVGDEQSAQMLNEQSGILKSGTRSSQHDIGTPDGKFNHGIYGEFNAKKYEDVPASEGGASRFFYNVVQDQLDEGDPISYCKKSNTAEREAGLEDFEKVKGRANPHPTVKPIDLSRYLAAMLLPPAKYAPRRLLVPFAGVHSEAIGAILAGWEEIVAIEIDPKYCELGKARVRYWKEKK